MDILAFAVFTVNLWVLSVVVFAILVVEVVAVVGMLFFATSLFLAAWLVDWLRPVYAYALTAALALVDCFGLMQITSFTVGGMRAWIGWLTGHF